MMRLDRKAVVRLSLSRTWRKASPAVGRDAFNCTIQSVPPTSR